MELRQLRTFVMVSEVRSVTVAAQRMGYSQSAVSQQVANLERALGARVFERSPDGMVLTARGARLLPHAQRIVRAIDMALHDMRLCAEDAIEECGSEIAMTHSRGRLVSVVSPSPAPGRRV
jgi:DNA-binding transcriptional LysR family regulator